MNFSYSDSIFNLVILGIHIFVQVAAASLIYIKHHGPQDRSWRYIILFFVISAVGSVAEMILMTSKTALLDYYKLLHPTIIVPSFAIYALLLCYIIEIINPRWLTLKRAVVIFLPSVILAGYVYFYVFQGNLVNIYSITNLKALWSTPNVLARIIFVSIYLPYSLMLIAFRFKWKNPQTQKYVDMLVLYAILLCVSYIFSRGLQTFPGYIVHSFLYLLLTITIVYTEHYERLHIPLESIRTYYEQPEVPNNTLITVNAVAQNLRDLMDSPKVWQDPELSADKIVKLAGTNRTYVQHAAKQLGFANITDMLHRRRIDYICDRLRQDPNSNIQDLFWDAGYRSRATAWRHFTNIVGRTPTEFVKRLAPPDKKLVIK